ncbi:Replication-associated polyprotein [Privet leaf blotch-associated virus]|uniref:Replication-associated polyprotein n=1 Tax=Privet leaf blotch-associated virus TaxID=1811408 RepID=A0A1E1JQ47_9VIRU|nr:Replication-associated polyprotein [Privet leaf blotch-associated virus]CZS63540.1 Replication-associated polyprotein [Privet leaf blotch-associated virus]
MAYFSQAKSAVLEVVFPDGAKRLTQIDNILSLINGDKACYLETVALEMVPDKLRPAVCVGLSDLATIAQPLGDELDDLTDMLPGYILKQFLPASAPIRDFVVGPPQQTGWGYQSVGHFRSFTLKFGATVADLPDDVVFGCSVFSSEFEEKVKELRLKVLNDVDSGVSRILQGDFEADLRHLIAENRKGQEIPVPQVLSDEDTKILRDHFPNVSLKFTKSVDGPHNMAAAHRNLETWDLVHSFPTDTPVIDIGGNWFYHIRYGNTHVHSCCPILDPRDAARQTHRCVMLDSMMSNLKTKFSKIFSNLEEKVSRRDTRAMENFYRKWAVHPKTLYDMYSRRHPNQGVYCHHAFGGKGYCAVQAKYAMMVHSGYDLALGDLINGLVAHGVLELRGYMIADPSMLVCDKGYLPVLKCNWEKRNGDIWFSFKDDSTMGYKHNWKLYSQYLQRTTIWSKGKQCLYVMERDKYRHGTLQYTITGCDMQVPSGTYTLYHNAWFRDLFDKYIIQIPEIKLKSLKDPEGSKLSFRDLVVARDLVDRVTEICLRGVKDFPPLQLDCKDEKQHAANLQLIQTHLLSHSQTVVLNGTTIVRANPIPCEDFSPLSLSIYFEVILTKKKEVLMYGWMSNDCDAGFLSPAWYKTLGRFLKRVFLAPFSFLTRMFSALMPLFDDQKFIESLIRKPEEKVTVLDRVRVSLEGEYRTDIYGNLVTLHSYRPVSKEFDDREFDGDFFDTIESLALLEEKVIKKEVEETLPALDVFLLEEVDHFKVDGRTRPISPEDNVIQKSVAEYISYNSTEYNRIVEELRSAWNNVKVSGGAAGYSNDKCHYGIYSRKSGWLLPVQDLDHECGFSESLVWITVENGLPVWEGDDLLVVNDNTRLVNNIKLARSVADNFDLLSIAKIPQFHIIDGVTGCGKTTEIVKTGNKPSVVILSVCKANVEEIRRALPGCKSSRVRTLDSYLLNPNVTCETLFIDEFGLAHPGALPMAAVLTKCKRCILFGDTEQIPFCNRIDDFVQEYKSIEDIIQVTREVRTKTYRCPQDITYILQDVYLRKKIETVSQVEESINIKSIRSENDIPLPGCFPDSVIYICMTQHDQALLSLRWKKEGIDCEVRTVHAAQGLSYPYVVYFRLTRTDNDLFTINKRPYHLVAISRHKVGLTYATVKIEDEKDFSLRLLRKRYKASKSFVTENSVHQQMCTLPSTSTSLIPYLDQREISEKAIEASNMNFPVTTEPVFFIKENGEFGVNENVGRAIGNEMAVVMAIEELCPGNTLYDDTGVNDIVNLSPLRCEVGKIRWDLSYLTGKWTTNFVAEPLLPTGALTRRGINPKQSLLAIEKRNANVLNCQGFSDRFKIAEKAVDKFFQFFFHEDKLQALPCGVVGSSSDSIQMYYDKAKKTVDEYAVLPLSNIDRYRHMIKRDIKPVLDTSLQSEYTKAATITYHQTDITQIATSFFTVIKQRIMQCKKSKLIIPIDTESDISETLTRDHLGSETGDFTEIDFSKFDKSQNEVHQIMQDLILLRLGGSLELVSIWSQAHRHSRIKDFNCGISFSTDFQRRTGDAFTFLGNTLVTACMLSYVLSHDDERKLRYMLVGGDDSLICGFEPIQVQLSPLSTLFNMSCKLISPSCPYFASRYIVRVRDRMVCVPDPMKLLVKMGRKDLPDNEESLEEVRIGLLDCCKPLLDDEVKQLVCILVQLRYRRESPSLFDALGFITKALATKTNFLKLFQVNGRSAEKRVFDKFHVR